MVTRQQELMEEENFYQTLDKETRGSCCSCYTFTILFLGLLGFVIAATYFGAKYLSSQTDNTSPTPTSFPTAILTPAHSPSSTSNEQSSTDQNRLIINDSELQDIIWSGPQLMLPLINKTASVTSDGLVLSGSIPGVSSSVRMILKPEIQDNSIVITNATLSQGPREFGDEFFGVIKDKVGTLLTKAVKKRTKSKLSQISTEPGQMILK